MSEQMKLAKETALKAQKAGADDARVFVSRKREVQVEWRDGKLDRIRESTRQGLSISLLVDGRYSANATSDLRPDALAKYVAEAVAATRYLAPDEHRKLPDPTRYEGLVNKDLELRDPLVAEVTPEQRLARAQELEAAVRSSEGADKLVSVTGVVSDVDSTTVGFATNGFAAVERTSFFVEYAVAAVRDEGDRKPSAHGYGQARHRGDMPAPDSLGREALERALAQCGSKQVKTGKYTVLIENRNVGGLIRHLLGPMSGSSIQQKRSFLEGKLGQPVTTDKLTLVDNPHVVRGISSTAWDGEGMATRVRPVLDKGVLQLYFLDTYYGSKLGMEPTMSGTSNLDWSLGKRNAEEIVKDLDEGILVTSFLGGNSNGTTGDFSLGIKGFYIKGGKRVQPVSEMNIAGNHLQLWQQLVELGNDPFQYSSTHAPTLVFQGVECSGSK